MTVAEIYDQTIRPLSAADRLRLAKLILQDIPPEWLVDAADEWSEEDYHDFAQASWRQAEAAVREPNDARAR